MPEKRPFPVLFAALWLVGQSPAAGAEVQTIGPLHSHNDYEQRAPSIPR
jgi:hypothetical protein